MIALDLVQQLQQLVAHIQGLGPGERERAGALVQTVLDLHGAALAQLLELIGREGDAGRRILAAVAEEDPVRHLLLLHGLHPQDLETRTRAALARVRPFLHSQGAEVELAAIADDAVRLRLQRRGSGYPASEPMLRGAIEEAIATAAPDVRQIEFVEPDARFPLPVLDGRSRRP